MVPGRRRYYMGKMRAVRNARGMNDGGRRGPPTGRMCVKSADNNNYLHRGE